MQAVPVTIGPGTKVGFGVGGAAFLEALIALVFFNDHSQQTLGVVMGGVVSALLLAVTILGRQLQAGKNTDAAAAVAVATVHTDAAAKVLSPSAQVRGLPSDPALEVPGGGTPV